MLRRGPLYALALVGSGVVGAISIGQILAAAGHPAAPLDDAFIHLQFARRLSEGSFFSYMPGEGYSTGSTSLLWPLFLAPFHAIGVSGVSLLWVTWIAGMLAHAALAVESARLADRLAGRAAGMAAGAMCLVFGAFAWFAYSGMETIPFAWLLMRAARVASENASSESAADRASDGRAERSSESGSEAAAERSPPRASRAAELIVLGIAAPLLRPEGFLASIIAAAGIALERRRTKRGSLWIALAPLAGPLIIPALNLALAGRATSTAALVKWLVADPYYQGSTIALLILENARLLVTSLLYGEDWTAFFLPAGSNVAILLGLPALFIAGVKRRANPEAAFVGLIALGALLPCSYSSFLWNRVRYLWPFAGAFFVMLACLARELGDLSQRLGSRLPIAASSRRLGKYLTFVTPLVCSFFTAAIASRLPTAIHDLASSALAVDQQQVALARWASESLPSDARIGVNDAGAIGYIAHRRTFDVVGLTTESEARYWVAGAGSRFEHYERLPRALLPTHFIVYPEWMACPPVLGRELKEATVEGSSILGGSTMVAYEARYDALGSGASPVLIPPGASLIDEIDVSDLESEAAHGYVIGRARDDDNQAIYMLPPDPETPLPFPSEIDPRDPWVPFIADGGRLNRTRDQFTAKLPRNARVAFILRVAAESGAHLSISAAGRHAGEIDVPSGDWVERTIEFSTIDVSDLTTIEITADESKRWSAFHYWLYRLQ